jgi:hypothetical protein
MSQLAEMLPTWGMSLFAIVVAVCAVVAVLRLRGIRWGQTEITFFDPDSPDQ